MNKIINNFLIRIYDIENMTIVCFLDDCKTSTLGCVSYLSDVNRMKFERIYILKTKNPRQRTQILQKK